MEYISVLVIGILILVIMYFIFEINIKKIKKVVEAKDLDEIATSFPENIEICRSILKKIKNEKVKIKESSENSKNSNENKNNGSNKYKKDSKTSLYIAITDTIFIADIKDSYTRIQTIAHECLHSIQDKRLLIFNFIYSNIYYIYLGLIIILTIFNVIKNYNIQIIILLLMGFVYYIVRSYLEIDAMTKARYVAKEYMEEYIKENKNCTYEDMNKIINKYDEINGLGIKATNYLLFFNCVIKVLLYIIILFLCKVV